METSIDALARGRSGPQTETKAATSGRPDERRLVARARKGDTAAFGVLYDLHMPTVYRYLRYRVPDAATAEDLCQDVFVSAWGAIDRFRWREGGLRAWLLRTAHNRLANHWRYLGRRPAPAPLDRDDDEPGGPPPPAAPEDGLSEVERRLDLAHLDGLLGLLTEAQREVLALRFGLELSVAETAAVMDRSQSAVKQLTFAALGKFRDRLAAEGDRS